MSHPQTPTQTNHLRLQHERQRPLQGDEERSRATRVHGRECMCSHTCTQALEHAVRLGGTASGETRAPSRAKRWRQPMPHAWPHATGRQYQHATLRTRDALSDSGRPRSRGARTPRQVECKLPGPAQPPPLAVLVRSRAPSVLHGSDAPVIESNSACSWPPASWTCASEAAPGLESKANRVPCGVPSRRASSRWRGHRTRPSWATGRSRSPP